MSEADDARALAALLAAPAPDFAKLAGELPADPAALLARYVAGLAAFEAAVDAAVGTPCASAGAALASARSAQPLHDEIGTALYALQRLGEVFPPSDVATVREGGERYQRALRRWVAWLNEGRATVRARGAAAEQSLSDQLAAAEEAIAAAQRAERARQRGNLIKLRPKLQLAAALAANASTPLAHGQWQPGLRERAVALRAEADRLLRLTAPSRPS